MQILSHPLPGDLFTFLCFFYSSTPQTPREKKDFMKGGDLAMAAHDIVGIGALVPGGVSKAACKESMASLCGSDTP
jgi:hypothetical protein